MERFIRAVDILSKVLPAVMKPWGGNGPQLHLKRGMQSGYCKEIPWSPHEDLFSPLASQALLAIWDILGLTEPSPHLCLHPHVTVPCRSMSVSRFPLFIRTCWFRVHPNDLQKPYFHVRSYSQVQDFSIFGGWGA